MIFCIKIYVCLVPYQIQVTEEQLAALFSAYGQVSHYALLNVGLSHHFRYLSSCVHASFNNLRNQETSNCLPFRFIWYKATLVHASLDQLYMAIINNSSNCSHTLISFSANKICSSISSKYPSPFGEKIIFFQQIAICTQIRSMCHFTFVKMHFTRGNLPSCLSMFRSTWIYICQDLTFQISPLWFPIEAVLSKVKSAKKLEEMPGFK